MMAFGDLARRASLLAYTIASLLFRRLYSEQAQEPQHLSPTVSHTPGKKFGIYSPETDAFLRAQRAGCCEILASRDIPFLFIAEEAFKYYIGEEVDLAYDLLVVVDNVEVASQAMEMAGMIRQPRYIRRGGTSPTREWDACYAPAKHIRYSSDSFFVIPGIVLLPASEWQLGPSLADAGVTAAHLPSLPDLIQSLLSVLLSAERESDLWSYCFELAETAYIEIQVLHTASFAGLLPPKYRMMHSQFVAEQALGLEFLHTQEDTQRYRMVGDSGTISDEDESKVCQDAGERFRRTHTHMTRRDSTIGDAGHGTMNRRQWLHAAFYREGPSFEMRPCP